MMVGIPTCEALCMKAWRATLASLSLLGCFEHTTKASTLVNAHGEWLESSNRRCLVSSGEVVETANGPRVRRGER